MVTAVFFGVVLADLLGLTGATAAGAVVVPLLATQILWVNLVTDSGPALALGVDPEIDDVMARPPRGLGEPILDRPMWRRVLGVGLALGLMTLVSIDRFLPGGLLPGEGSLETARTAGFTTLVLAQLLLAVSARSQTQPAWRRLGSNRWLLAALALGAALQVAVVEMPPFQRAFGTTSLTPGQWAWTVGSAVVVLLAAELDKLPDRRRAAR
ncbi:MAG: cation-translocating P-type ATPase C-terminal domain-containing protein [Nocardioides sp.]